MKSLRFKSMPGQYQKLLHTTPMHFVPLHLNSGFKLEVCTIEMLIKTHRYLSNSYTTTTTLMLKRTLPTTETKSTPNVEFHDLHASADLENEASSCSEAQCKHCQNPKFPLAHRRLPVSSCTGRIAVRPARGSRCLSAATRRRSPRAGES